MCKDQGEVMNYDRIRIILKNDGGSSYTHAETKSLFGDLMTDGGAKYAGYIVMSGILACQYIHQTPTEDTPSDLLLYFAKNNMHGFSFHVYGEKLGGMNNTLLYVIPPFPETIQ